MDLQTILDYSARFRARLRGALASITTEQWTREFHNIGNTTLRDTLLHIVQVEDGWVQFDILGRTLDDSIYASEHYPTVVSLFSQWDTVRQQTLDFIVERGPDGSPPLARTSDEVKVPLTSITLPSSPSQPGRTER